MKTLRAFILLCACCLLSCVSSAVADEIPIKIGVILGLTGPGAKWSAYQRMGIELALDELRKDGRKVEVIFEDSRTETQQSVAAFHKLVEVDHVQAVVGDIFAMLTEPLIPLADKAKVLLLTPSLPGAVCAKSSGYVFTAAAQIPVSLPAWGSVFRHRPEIKRIASVFFDDPGWGNTLNHVWRTAASEHSVQVVAQFESADFVPDFRSAFPKILKQKPDAFFIAHEPFIAIRTLKELTYSGTIVFANNVMEVLTPDSTFDKRDLEKLLFVDTAPTQAFLDTFEAKFKTPRLLEAEASYEALRSVVKAIEANPAAPALGIRSVRYPGVVGMIDYTSGCSGNKAEWHLKGFKNGKPVVIE